MQKEWLKKLGNAALVIGLALLVLSIVVTAMVENEETIKQLAMYTGMDFTPGMADTVINMAERMGFDLEPSAKIGLTLYGLTPVLQTAGIILAVLGLAATLCAKQLPDGAERTDSKTWAEKFNAWFCATIPEAQREKIRKVLGAKIPELPLSMSKIRLIGIALLAVSVLLMVGTSLLFASGALKSAGLGTGLVVLMIGIAGWAYGSSYGKGKD